MARIDEIRRQLAALEDPVALLEGIFAYSPVAFQIYRADGRCVLVNQAFRDLFQSVPPPEYNVLQDEIAERNGVLGLIHRAFAGETISTPPIWYDPRELTQVKVTEGRRVAMSSTFFPLRARDGHVTHVAIVFEDITAEMLGREQAEAARAAAEASERRAQLLADAGQVLAASLDYEQTLQTVARLAVPAFADFCVVDLLEPDGHARRVAAAHRDPQKAELLEQLRRRYPPDARSPQPAARAMHEGRAVLHDEIDQVTLDAITVDEEHRALLRRLGVRCDLAVPLAARGRIIGALSFGSGEGRPRYGAADVRLAESLAARAALAIDNARLYAQAEEVRRSAEEASRAKDEFLAMLGHELRNPLAPIATALELIRLRGGEREPRRELEVIERQVRHLVRLVDDLLDVSRITRGKIELRRARVELTEAVQKAVEMASPLLEQRRHRLTVDVPRGLVLDADEARLAQVVANLLTNAAKYTDAGGQIRVEAAREDGEVTLAVVDDGRGIEPEMLPRIFELFVQGRRALDRAEGGLGLGLALVRTLTELHGGRVDAHSDGPGRGSRFALHLPLAGPAVADDTRARARARTPSGARVLVVDDNDDAAALLSEVLSSVGHEVAVAHDGPEALTLSRRFSPQVAVLDIGLPVMDGYELARRLRTELPSLRLLAVTGYGQETDRARSREAGFAAHLVKPVDVAALLAAVDER